MVHLVVARLYSPKPSLKKLELGKEFLIQSFPDDNQSVIQFFTLRFINLSIAHLTDKYYGESQKLAHAVFSLARKIQPCIIFIDEIDSFLRSRDSHDHEATAMLKAQFMSHWDGLLSSRKSRVNHLFPSCYINDSQNDTEFIFTLSGCYYWCN